MLTPSPTFFGSIGPWLAQVLAGTLSVATITAVTKWLYSQQHRITSARASYLAQLESLQATVEREIEFVQSGDHPFSWFPILPYFESEEKPLALAGILSYEEVREITSTYLAYKETLIYLTQYGQPSKDNSVVGCAIGLNLKNPVIKKYYPSDLRTLKRNVDSSIRALRRARNSRYVLLIRLFALILGGAALYFIGLISAKAALPPVS
jgi:hypothetical protein